MTLQVWIDKTGRKKVAQLLDVDSMTVRYWKIGHAVPRPKHMVKIHQLSRGKVTYKTMVETAAKKQK